MKRTPVPFAAQRNVRCDQEIDDDYGTHTCGAPSVAWWTPATPEDRTRFGPVPFSLCREHDAQMREEEPNPDPI